MKLVENGLFSFDEEKNIQSIIGNWYLKNNKILLSSSKEKNAFKVISEKLKDDFCILFKENENKINTLNNIVDIWAKAWCKGIYSVGTPYKFKHAKEKLKEMICG